MNGFNLRRYGLVLPIVLALGSAPSLAQEPQIVGGRIGGAGYPFFSPPSWYGSGPAGRNRAPEYYDWQYYGVTGGPNVNPGYAFRGPGGFFPGAWGVPGAAGSFWTNGLSLYGPPIPTYGPTPGSFGNADNSRFFFRAPPPGYGAWVGLGWGGTYTPSPRLNPRTVSVYPQAVLQPSSVQIISCAPVLTSSGDPMIRLNVKLADPSADVWIEKTAMKQQGTERVYDSPPLQKDGTYKYELLARWKDNGRERAESRTVTAKPGQTISVDFTIPADESGIALVP